MRAVVSLFLMPKIKFLTNTRTFLTISSVLRLLNWSNCCCVMGGRTALRGLWAGLWWDGVLGVEMSELVIEAMRCRGLAEDVAKSSGPVGGKMEFSGLGAVEEPLLAWLPAHTQTTTATHQQLVYGALETVRERFTKESGQRN